MHFDAAGNAVVSFPDMLVMLAREARQLSELGLKVKEPIQRRLSEAERVYRFAV